HFVAIEVKSKNNYDEEKTKKIMEGYKEFFYRKDSQNDKDSFTLVIFKPDEYKFDGMSTIESVNNKIQDYRALPDLLNDIIKDVEKNN
ncbi:hypothetical protein C4M83_04460, partial [Mycoplasmopsis pullorum]